MAKKILKISAYILILLAISLGAYYFMLSTNEPAGTGEKKSFFGNLFPFGNNEVVTEIPFSTTTPNIIDEPLTGTFEQIVRLISNEPVAGSIFISNTKGDVVRYIEKATGHVYDVPTYENTTSRVTNTTIPQIYEAKFTESGAGFIAQYMKSEDNVETMYGKITGTSTEKTVSGTILSRNILSFAVSPNTRNIFTLEKTPTGSEGYISTPNGTNKKLVWSSPLKEFIPQFISETHIGLQSKPHPSAFGLLFDINTTNAAKNVVISNQTNLTTLPYTKNSYVLYANNSGLFSLNTARNTQNELSPNTFPEKCVWANTKLFVYCGVPKSQLNSNSLYSWYKGEVSYSDTIWEYNITSNTARQMTDLKDLSGRDIDISEISINQNDTLLLIESKIDGSLWSVKIN